MAMEEAKQGAKFITTVSKIASNSSTIVFDLSSISGSENYILWKNFFPIMKRVYFASPNALSVGGYEFSYSYNQSTKKLTVTWSADNYIYLYAQSYAATCYIYAL